jgi:hypothetical protein
LTVEKPVSVYDMTRQFYPLMFFIAVVFVSSIVTDVILLASLLAVFGSQIWTLFAVESSILLLYIPIYLMIRGKMKVQFYEDYVRFFQREGDPIDIPYSGVALDIKSETHVASTYITCILSAKGSGNGQS